MRQRAICWIVLNTVILLSNLHAEISMVLFSPDDHPKTKLIELINKASKKIHAAVYMLTDKQIAHALIEAKKRNIDVKIIVDKSSMDSSFGKGKLLKQHKIQTLVFKTRRRLPAMAGRHPKAESKSTWGTPLMHNKFALIDNTVWTGSFNWTKSANERNEENVYLTDNIAVYKRYEERFEVLAKRCETCKFSKEEEKESTSEPSHWQKCYVFFKVKMAQAWNSITKTIELIVS